MSTLKFTHIIQNVRFSVSLQDTGALREIHFYKRWQCKFNGTDK